MSKKQVALSGDTPCEVMDEAVKSTPPSGKKRKIGILAAVATIGGFLFGYDTGVISGALPYMYMPMGKTGGLFLTPDEEGWLVSLLLIGAAFGALIGGRLSDKFGRRHNILLLAAIFIIGSIGTGLAPNVYYMYIARFILGFAVGGASATVPVYLSESAPRRIRGTIVAVDQLMIVIGQLSAFVINAVIKTFNGAPKLRITNDPMGLLTPGEYDFDKVNGFLKAQGGTMDVHEWHNYVGQLAISGGNGHSWRVMFLLCTIPAILLWIGMRLMPESPRWYVSNKRFYEAIGSLKRIRDVKKDDPITDELGEMIASHERNLKEKKGSFGEVWRTPWMRKLLLVGVFLAITNQTTGVNTVMYYAPKVLQFSGMSTDAAITATIANGVMSVIGCSLGLWFVSRFPRRKVLITCLFLVFITLGVISALFFFVIEPAMTSSTKPSPAIALMVLALMSIFMLVVQSSNGPVVWTMLGEMFPSRVRGIMNGTAVFCMWIVNALIGKFFPTMMATLGGAKTYGIFAIINIIFAFVLVKVMPETSTLSLEEIEVYVEKRYS